MIANFRRGDRIGIGSFGNVYKAEWNGRLVAAKELHEFLFEPHDPNGHVAKFEAECRILQRLEHKNVVRLLEFVISHSSPPMLITELLDRDLGSYIGSLHPAKIPFEQTVSIMLDVAEGLAYLHDRNPPIVHRDLACKNVLLTEQRQAKIADLGLAKVFPRNGRMHASPVPGTPAYAAPETYPPAVSGNADRRQVQYGVKIDIFSFGVMLMEVVNGSRPNIEPAWPFRTDGRRIPEKERRKGDIEKMSGHKLREIVLQCIEDSSEERPSAEDVFKILRNEWSKIRQKQNIADNQRGPQLKIAVLGHLGVGKTCLISRYVDHNFDCEFVASTINADQFFSGITLHDKEFRLQIIDTAGQEKFRSIIPNSIRNSQGVVLVFDLTNRSSLVDGIPEMLEIVKANTPDCTSLILVGNKADMADRDVGKRVHKEEAEQRAQDLGIRRYVETSATKGQNLERVFQLITNDIYDTLDLSDIDIYVPGTRRDHIEVTNEDAPRNRSFLEKIADCFQSIRSLFGS